MLLNNYSKIADYEIINLIGIGAFSKVYKVKRKIDKQIFALKKIELKSISYKAKLNSFNEIKFLTLLNKHKNNSIISYIDSFYDNNYLYLITEFAEFGDLQKLINFKKTNKVYFSEKIIKSLFYQIIKALYIIHKNNIIHRDIKAGNILIFEYNEIEEIIKIKIGDLNVSKLYNNNNLSHTQTGTPFYASPEVWENKPYDYKSDIWSLGCLFYELVTLNPPFHGKSLNEIYYNIKKCNLAEIPYFYDNEFKRIIDLCIKVDSNLRPTSEELFKYINSIWNNNNENEDNFENETKEFYCLNCHKLYKPLYKMRNKSEIFLRNLKLKNIGNNYNENFNYKIKNDYNNNNILKDKIIAKDKSYDNIINLKDNDLIKNNYHFRELYKKKEKENKILLDKKNYDNNNNIINTVPNTPKVFNYQKLINRSLKLSKKINEKNKEKKFNDLIKINNINLVPNQMNNIENRLVNLKYKIDKQNENINNNIKTNDNHSFILNNKEKINNSDHIWNILNGYNENYIKNKFRAKTPILRNNNILNKINMNKSFKNIKLKLKNLSNLTNIKNKNEKYINDIKNINNRNYLLNI